MFGKLTFFHWSSIRSKLIISFLLVVVLPVMSVYSISYRVFEKSMQDELNKSVSTSLNVMERNVNNFLTIMVAATNQIVMDRDIQLMVSSGNKAQGAGQGMSLDLDEFYMLRSKIMNVQNSTLFFTNNSKILLMDFQNRIYKNNEEISDAAVSEIKGSQWFKDTIEMGGYLNWILPDEKYTSYLKSSISVAAAIKGADGIKVEGVAVISLDAEDLIKFLFSSSETDEKNTFVVSDEGIVISNPEKNLIGKQNSYLANVKNEIGKTRGSEIVELEGKKTLLNFLTINRTGWKIVSLIGYDEIFGKLTRDRNILLLITFCFLMLFYIISLFIAVRLTNPIKEMCGKMKQIEKGNLDVKIDLDRKDEFGILARGFNEMTGNIKQLVEQIKEEQKRKHLLKLEALQAQINPHFLFNTLNAIKWTATLNQDSSVVNMLSSLGYILELSINKGSEYIMLSEEIEALNSYILIQRLRYNRNFTVEYDIEKNTEGYLVPKLILQPIVENSLIHGFDENHKYLEIKVSVLLKDSQLYICISDNGAGISPDKLGTLLVDGEKTPGKRFSSIGLKNVHERILLDFGAPFGLQITSSEQSGTLVTLCIPAMKEITQDD